MFFGSTKFVFVVKHKKTSNVKPEGSKLINKCDRSAQQVNTVAANTSVSLISRKRKVIDKQSHSERKN